MYPPVSSDGRRGAGVECDGQVVFPGSRHETARQPVVQCQHPLQYPSRAAHEHGDGHRRDHSGALFLSHWSAVTEARPPLYGALRVAQDPLLLFAAIQGDTSSFGVGAERVNVPVGQVRGMAGIVTDSAPRCATAYDGVYGGVIRSFSQLLATKIAHGHTYAFQVCLCA
jgi:hypothetical protein